MNNKRLGNSFELEVCTIMSNLGYWVHFLSPDPRGAQPFDIIAVKNGKARAIECKTLSEDKHYFPIDRLEDNQILAFEKWMQCGNDAPMVAVKWGTRIRLIDYRRLKELGKIDMRME